MLGIEPTVGEDVLLLDAVLGAYTEVKAHSELEDVTLGDFSYCAGYNQIFAADIGKFCSIATFVRINPGAGEAALQAIEEAATHPEIRGGKRMSRGPAAAAGRTAAAGPRKSAERRAIRGLFRFAVSVFLSHSGAAGL